MVIAAASPVIDNPSGNPVFDLPSLPASLDAAGVGRAFAAWTRLPYEERLQASYERHAVAAVLEAEDYHRLDDFVAPMLPTFCAET